MPTDDEIAAGILHEWKIPVTSDSVRMAKGTFAFAARRVSIATTQVNRAIIAALPRWLRRWVHA